MIKTVGRDRRASASRSPSLTTVTGVLLQVLPESDEAANMMADTVLLKPLVFWVS